MALDFDMALMILLADEERKMYEEARGIRHERQEERTYTGADLFARLFQSDKNTM